MGGVGIRCVVPAPPQLISGSWQLMLLVLGVTVARRVEIPRPHCRLSVLPSVAGSGTHPGMQLLYLYFLHWHLSAFCDGLDLT